MLLTCLAASSKCGPSKILKSPGLLEHLKHNTAGVDGQKDTSDGASITTNEQWMYSHGTYLLDLHQQKTLHAAEPDILMNYEHWS
jgi:hypothetical protein